MICTKFVKAVAAAIDKDPPTRTSEAYLSKHFIRVLTTAIRNTYFDDDDDDDWKRRTTTTKRRRRKKADDETTTTEDYGDWAPDEAQLVISYGGSLWVYDRIVWRRIEDEDLWMLLYLYDGRKAKIGEKGSTMSMTDRKAKSVSKICLNLHTTRRPEFFDKPPAGLAFTDGYWTVEGGVLECLPHHPKNKPTFSYPFDLDGADAQAKAWIRFLDSVWRDDEDLPEKKFALQEWLGAALIGKGVDFARCALFVGGGGNGKSVLMHIIEELFPPETVTTASPAHWDKEYTIATLRDARLNVCSELPEYRALDTSDTFKAIIAGDRTMARLPYREPFSFRPRASHLFAANALPSVGSGDFTHGFFRRFLVFTFNRNFTSEEDGAERRPQGDILDEIREEHASIIVWALAGACRLMRRREYTLPHSHQATLEEWRQDSDPVQDFLNSCCADYEKGSSLAHIYSDYVEWSENVGRKRMGTRKLARRMQELGVKRWRTRDGAQFAIRVKMKAKWLDAN